MTAFQSKTLLLLKPRGFCAGVVRAIDIVRIALDAFGPPIYVRKEIVHNRYVVEELKAKGAIFVDEVDEDGTLSFQLDRKSTSELQSRLHLVCRLLLEKKKKTKIIIKHDLRIILCSILT